VPDRSSDRAVRSTGQLVELDPPGLRRLAPPAGHLAPAPTLSARRMRRWAHMFRFARQATIGSCHYSAALRALVTAHQAGTAIPDQDSPAALDQDGPGRHPCDMDVVASWKHEGGGCTTAAEVWRKLAVPMVPQAREELTSRA
jgi:hypothetical protein